MDIALLYEVADKIKTGWELCGSRWGNSEAETIACQAIASCRLNHRNHGDAFSWAGKGLRAGGGCMVFDNPKGMRSLLDDKCIVIEPYTGPLTPSEPETIQSDDRGKFMVLRVTDRLLHYVKSIVD